jgi:branched-chain amino acid transport system permease protein
MKRYVPLAALLVAAALLPFAFTSYYAQTILNLVLINAIITIGFYVIFGLTGVFSMAQVAFWGIGAYTSALVATKLGWPWWSGFILAPLVAAAFGILLGAPTLRLKTHYLTMATIAFAEVVRQLMVNWIGLTNGPSGVRDIPSPNIGSFRFDSPQKYYYMGLALLVLVVVLTQRLRYSRLGRGLGAIRDDDLAAESMGVNITWLKIVAFAISAAFAGLAGAMYAHLIGYISPDVFHLEVAVVILAMLLIGGRQYVAGAILGAAAITWLPEVLRVVQDWWPIIYGALVLIVLALLPGGFWGLFLQIKNRFLPGRTKEEGAAE